MALVGKYGDNLTPASVDADLHEMLPDAPARAQLKAVLQEELWKFAGLAHRSQPMRRPVVFAQRGNAPRVRWSQE